MTELYRGTIVFVQETPDGDMFYEKYKIEVRRWVEDGAYRLSGEFNDRNCGRPCHYVIKIECENGLLVGRYICHESGHGKTSPKDTESTFTVTNLKFGKKMLVEGRWLEDGFVFRFRLEADLISTDSELF